MFGNYGTPKAPVAPAWRGGATSSSTSTGRGNQQLAQRAREDLVSVLHPAAFDPRTQTAAEIAGPDSAEVVAQRTAHMQGRRRDESTGRNTTTSSSITRSTPASPRYAILVAERLKRQRQVGLHEFVKGLREGQ